MPRLQTLVGHLNSAFSEDNIGDAVKKRAAFAPGKQLSSALSLFVPSRTRLLRSFVSYIDSLPGSVQEAMRSTIYYALSTSPPTLVTLAWAPGYDFEVTMWQAPDTRETRGGITILIKGRYPSDTHPISPRKSRRR